MRPLQYAATVVAFTFLALGAGQVQGQTMIQVTNRGWVCDAVNTPCAVASQPGVTQANNGASPTNDIFAGSSRLPNDQGQTLDAGVYRNWFQFAIPKFSAPLVEATLTLPEPNRWNSDTHSYTIYQLAGQPMNFTDIKATKPLGVLQTTGTSIGTTIQLHFNADGLAAITAAQGGSLFLGGIDDGETLGGYHGDFAGTGPVGVEFPPYPNLDRSSPLTLYNSPFANTHTGFCPTPAPTSIVSFVIEHKLDLTTIQSTLTPNILPQFLPKLFSPDYEIRSRDYYSASTGIFGDDVFVVPAGAPLPTPASYDVIGNRFAYIFGPVDKVYMNCTPYASAMLVGRYTDGQPLLGNPAGAPFAFEFGYNLYDDAAHTFRDVTLATTSIGVTWKDYSWGILTLPPPPANPAPQPSAPTVTLSPSLPAGTTQVSTNPFLIDASQSYDPGGQSVSFQWSSTNTAQFTPNASSPKVQITFQGGYGDYPITLVVTNSAGVKSTVTFDLQYVR